jgi:AraC family ethanolamine operon transcriptional activator
MNQHSPHQSAPSGIPPWVTVYDLTDPTAVGDEFELLDQDAMQLKGTKFLARRVVVRLEGAAVVSQSTSVRLRVKTRVPADLLAITVWGPRARGSLNGVAVHPDLVLAGEPGVEGEFVVEPGYESVTFLFPPKVLIEHLHARGREGDFKLPSGAEFWQSESSGARRLFALGKRIAETAARQAELFEDNAAARVAGHIEVLESILTVFETAEDVGRTRSDETRQGHSEIVKISEAVALEQGGQRLYVTDLCKAAGVSQRTLQSAFQGILGMSPMAYLRRLKLHRVRQALRTSRYCDTTVTREAVRWGFWHFGDFSRAYKECFGEVPSETLKRRTADEVAQSA